MSERFIKILFLGLPSVIIIIFIVSFITFLIRPVRIEETKLIEIRKGMPFNVVVKMLYENRIISDIQKFRLLAALFNADKKVHAGEYEFVGNLTPQDVLKIIMSGKIKRYVITIPEGFTSSQIYKTLSSAGIGEMGRYLEIGASDELLKKYGIDAPDAEGYLFPDTYIFHKGMSEEDIISRMIENFNKKALPLLMSEHDNKGLSFRDVIILASIIQKETYIKEEMPLVSAVFHNRLKRRIPLQADPTVIYVIPDFAGNLRKVDLSIKSPYNTYIHRGLPPGPISNPGIDAINAALKPADVPYLYFVSRNDGTHEFSSTLMEHNRSVRIFQQGEKRLDSGQ